MDSATIIKYWHYAGMAATTLGVVSSELVPLTAACPQAAPIITALGAVSLSITSIMNKLANDKVIAAVINDPTGPTPQGLGIPKPTNPEVIAQIAK